MKKTQNRKIKAILADYKTLSETLSKKSEIMKTLSKKYSISTKTISRMLKADNTFEKTDNVSTKMDNNIPCSNQNVPESEIPPEGGWFNGIFYDPIDPDYDYDNEADDLLEEYFKTHDRNDVSGIYFDENDKLKIKTL